VKKARAIRSIKPKYSIGKVEELDISIEPGEIMNTTDIACNIKELNVSMRTDIDDSIHYGKVLKSCKARRVGKKLY